MSASKLPNLSLQTAWRQTWVLAGEAAWARKMAAGPLAGTGLWVGSSVPNGYTGIAARQAHRTLGQEWSVIVVDCHEGLDPDALGIVTGTLCAGGLLLLLTPPLALWHDHPDPDKQRYASFPLTGADVGGRFLQRLAGLLMQSPGVKVIEQGQPEPEIWPSCDASVSALQQPAQHDVDCRTADQAAAVAAVHRVAKGHRRRPLVLTADRGRGKSAALGIAAARLLSEGLSRIIVTAPRAAAVSALFERAEGLLSDAVRQDNALLLTTRELRFMTPDALLQQQPDADLVLVDEAAAIPVPTLSRLLARYSRIVFASTVHGYEGNGRGFAIRFQAELDKRTPQWRALTLETPIRYAANDPLEAWVNQALLLDAEPVVLSVTPPVDGLTLTAVSPDTLVTDEALLRDTFGLLVQAHYQTCPADLRQLLDAPNVALWLARLDTQVVGVCVVLVEGGLDDRTAQAVAAGRRRPQGHLIPQSLAAHTGDAAFARQRTARVMRVAVHPSLQRQGIGRRLVHAACDVAREQGMDWFGASFAADAETLAFWQSVGCEAVRVGASRDSTSGCYSATLLKPLSEAALSAFSLLRQRYIAVFAHGLGDSWREMAADTAAVLLRQSAALPPPCENDVAAALAFAKGERDFTSCQLAIWHCLLWALANDRVIAQREVLLARVMQRWPDADVVRLAALPGRAALLDCLRSSVSGLLPESLG